MTIEDLDALWREATNGVPWVQWVEHSTIYAGTPTENARTHLTGNVQEVAETYGCDDDWDDDEDGPDGSTAEAKAALIVALVNAWPEVRERLRRAERVAGDWRFAAKALLGTEDATIEAFDRELTRIVRENTTLRHRLGAGFLEPIEDDDAGPMEACGECASTLCDGECAGPLRAALDDEAPR